jgi:hypothetical protein
VYQAWKWKMVATFFHMPGFGGMILIALIGLLFFGTRAGR